MKVYFTPTADEDLAQLKAYLEPRSPRAAHKHLVAVLTAARLLSEYPFVGRPGRVEDTRELPVPGIDYILVYELFGPSNIYVLRVLHGRQMYPP